MYNSHKTMKCIALAFMMREISCFHIPSINRNVAIGMSSRTLPITFATSNEENSATALTEKVVEENGKTIETEKEEIKQVKSDKKSTTENKNKKNGPLTPVVKGVKAALGEEEFKKLKVKGIGMHSDVIKGFVDTSDSKFGQFVLKQLFTAADKDGNGTIEQEELEAALKKLGFDFLKDNQVKGIFQRADLDKNGCLDEEEFMKAAPKALQQNLVKLAKNNGGDLGLLG